MADPTTFVEGHERLTSVFGHWPSFHDAEVLALGVERARRSGPSVALVVHLWESTGEVDERGFYRLVNHTRAAFRFHDCDEVNLDVAGFNHQNVLFGLQLSCSGQASCECPILVVLESIFGVGGSLRCRRAEVVGASPYNGGEEDGSLLCVVPRSGEI